MKLSDIPATLPQSVRDADVDTWRTWMDSRNVSTVDGKRTYVRHLSGFYSYIKKPVRDTDTVDISNYEQYMRESGKSEATVQHTIRTVKSYWKYAREQEMSKI